MDAKHIISFTRISVVCGSQGKGITRYSVDLGIARECPGVSAATIRCNVYRFDMHPGTMGHVVELTTHCALARLETSYKAKVSMIIVDNVVASTSHKVLSHSLGGTTGNIAVRTGDYYLRPSCKF